ncbi:MAG TPA: lysophospholipid acyltransferase family protein [Chroococcales cyanobacterium]
MQGLMTWLFIIYFFATSAVLYATNVIICLVTAPFDWRRRAVHKFSCYWGYHYFQINPFWHLHYEGVENIEPGKTYVLIANHNSIADILACYGLHRQFKWVSKVEISKVPLIGWNMYLNQYVLLKRGDMKSIKEMMTECKEWLNKGVSVMLFPEGTRSENGQIQTFRDGAFRMAVDCNVPVVPIVIEGTDQILKKGAKYLNFHQNINIKVLPPIDPAQFDGSSGKMRSYVHKVMVDTLFEMHEKSGIRRDPDQAPVAVP